ncbi:MAG TPA: hypothetical protein VFC63_13215 [Blastocatellia bacterium]|nr:hypothetical protein [Blastocatellia bacterium]
MREITEDNLLFDPFEVSEMPLTDAPAVNATQEDTSSFLRTMNHFNYFTEVEDEFVRRRGSHLLVSPMDWALIQTWKDSGVPLNIVLRGINQSFDSYDKRPLKTRKINSLLYCLQEVETCYALYRESQVGAHNPSNEDAQRGTEQKVDELSKQMILEFLTSRMEGLRQSHTRAAEAQNLWLTETIDRALSRLSEIVSEIESCTTLDSEGLERDIVSIEDLILEKILENVPVERRISIEDDGKHQLKAYKKDMPKNVYQQTLNNYIYKRLRELYGIPRLSLFYMY